MRLARSVRAKQIFIPLEENHTGLVQNYYFLNLLLEADEDDDII